jgi:ribonuclease PH
MLGLLATPSVPLRTTVTAREVVFAQGTAIVHPTEAQRQQASSRHVFGFDGNSGGLVVCESWGAFTVEEWDACIDAGEKDKNVEALLRERVKGIFK